MRYLKISILLLLRSLGVFAISRALTSHRLRILCYHGGQIGDEGRYNPLLFGSAALVRRRLQWLKDKGFSPSSIAVLDGSPKQLASKAPNLPVLITIDDGWYSSVLSIIRPCQEFNFPVCMYLATKYIQSGLPIAPVVLGYLVWKRRVRHLVCDAKIGGDIGLSGSYDMEIPADRQRFLRQAIVGIESLPSDRPTVVAAFERCASWLGVTSDELDLKSRRFDYLTPDEIVREQSPAVSFQIHGHVHHYPTNDLQALLKDIKDCKRVLSSIGVVDAKHYCYPSGSFDSNAAQAFAHLGIRSGTTCIPGLVDFERAGSLNYLPRFLDGENISQLEFEAEMSGVMDAVRALAVSFRLRHRPALVLS